MRRQTYGYLPSLGASPPFDHQYQIVLLADRGTCVWTTCLRSLPGSVLVRSRTCAPEWPQDYKSGTLPLDYRATQTCSDYYSSGIFYLSAAEICLSVISHWLCALRWGHGLCSRLQAWCWTLAWHSNRQFSFCVFPSFTTATSTTKGIRKVLQVDMLDWKIFQYLYTFYPPWDGKMRSNSFTWVTEGGDLGTADWGCLAGRCAVRLVVALWGVRSLKAIFWPLPFMASSVISYLFLNLKNFLCGVRYPCAGCTRWPCGRRLWLVTKAH